MDPVEEQRAADYRASIVRRAAATVARRLALRGSSTARAQLQQDWAPKLYPDEAWGRTDPHADLVDADENPGPFGPETN